MQSGAKKCQRIAILGGSFDPPTISHLQIAGEVVNLLKMDQVWIVPCGSRADKPQLNSPQQRFEMIKMAAAEFFPKQFPIKIDSTEVDNGA